MTGERERRHRKQVDRVSDRRQSPIALRPIGEVARRRSQRIAEELTHARNDALGRAELRTAYKSRLRETRQPVETA
jgi:F0F1-type ATP synthase membrane subunit b/b'